MEKTDFGIAHTKRVFDIAKQYFPVKPELQELTYTVIIFHDIGGSTINDQYEKGPRIATQILKKLGCSGDFVKQVCDTINTHHEHPNNPSEPFRALYDSDKLVMFSHEEYSYYNSRVGFDWDKIVQPHLNQKRARIGQKILNTKEKRTKQYPIR